jgi:hypothetical protein
MSKKEKLFKKSNCAGGLTNNNYTCYSELSLLKLRDFWNKRHPDNRIDTDDSKEIWIQLKNYMSNVCDRESCWLRQKFINENLDKELLQYTFAPKSPVSWKKNPNEWLSSLDIDKVMKQYEHAYSFFQFIGPSPIDFDNHKLYGECVWEELCKFDLYDYIKNGKTKIGIIFNTDPHYKSGSHWISMFIDVKKKFIYYFDSNGNKVPNEIKVLMDRIQRQGKNMNLDLKLMDNYNFQHQKSQSECGMYSLYFIIQLLKDEKLPEYFNTQIIKDDQVFKLRKVFFNEDL